MRMVKVLMSPSYPSLQPATANPAHLPNPPSAPSEPGRGNKCQGAGVPEIQRSTNASAGDRGKPRDGLLPAPRNTRIRSSRLQKIHRLQSVKWRLARKPWAALSPWRSLPSSWPHGAPSFPPEDPNRDDGVEGRLGGGGFCTGCSRYS